jgi:hypothetical protein
MHPQDVSVCFAGKWNPLLSATRTPAFSRPGHGTGGIGQPFPRFLIHVVPFTKKMIEHKTATADGFVNECCLRFDWSKTVGKCFMHEITPSIEFCEYYRLYVRFLSSIFKNYPTSLLSSHDLNRGFSRSQ